jgi:hypothetical protein
LAGGYLLLYLEMKKRGCLGFALVAVFVALGLFSSPSAAQAQEPAKEKPAEEVKEEPKEPNNFLLLGFSAYPSGGLANLWVASEGQDFSILKALMGGYEIGMFHRVYEDRLEYRFKTFFNLKWETIRASRASVYLGAGAGLFEVIRAKEMESGLSFIFGGQAILGLKIGPPLKEKFNFELQIVGANEEVDSVRIHLLAGVRF